MFIRGLTMTIAVWWAIETPLLAASLLDLRLVTDGSVDPPGDRLDVTVTFGPGEAQVRLHVQAMLVTGSDRSSVERVKSRGEPNSNPAGFFQTSLTVSPRPDAPLGSASVVVPYSELALPPGTHLLAYEVQGYVGTALHFIRPTRLTQVRVSEQARTRLTLTSSRPEARPIRRQMDAYELRGEAASKRRVVLTTTKYVPAEQRTEQAVEIPGEFVRSEASVLSKDLGDSPKAWIPLEELRPKHERTVHFATTRRAAEAAAFGAEVGDAVQYGSCTVNVPVDNHRRGALELPPGVRNWWKQFDPAKFFYVYDTKMVSQEQFVQALSVDDVVLYIHGFNTSFQHAVLTAAQLKHDLEFPGQVAAFSWPGDPAGSGLLGGYRLAEERVARSDDAFAEVLQTLLAPRASGEAGPRLHVIAHSLGNRILLAAVDRLVAERHVQRGTKVFGNVVLAAADVDWPTFAAQAPLLIGCSRRVTYYYSTEDFALQLSKSLHDDRPPIGLCPLLHPDVDTINADNVNEFSLGFGHRYFSASNPLLADLHLLVVTGLVPDKRQPPLGNKQTLAGYAHWEFVAARQ